MWQKKRGSIHAGNVMVVVGATRWRREKTPIRPGQRRRKQRGGQRSTCARARLREEHLQLCYVVMWSVPQLFHPLLSNTLLSHHYSISLTCYPHIMSSKNYDSNSIKYIKCPWLWMWDHLLWLVRVKEYAMECKRNVEGKRPLLVPTIEEGRAGVSEREYSDSPSEGALPSPCHAPHAQAATAVQFASSAWSCNSSPSTYCIASLLLSLLHPLAAGAPSPFLLSFSPLHISPLALLPFLPLSSQCPVIICGRGVKQRKEEEEVKSPLSSNTQCVEWSEW